MSQEPAAAEGAPVDMFGLVGTVLDHKFRVERLVAEGGFGVVYYGTHLTLERPIAIKVLKTPPEFNEKARAQFIEKFALEGKTMARISHPNIVQVLDFGASQMPSGDLAPWMVLEWLTGQTLEGLLANRRTQRFSPAEAIAVLRPVFDALAYAHDEGVAHRDIKPANLMVVQTKRGQTMRLMDFGIAKLMEAGEEAGSGATRTRTTMNAFSPQYAAPEQISGTRTGPWTDVHALALILTEMFTGMPPYDGEDMTQLFGQILSPIRPTPWRRGVDVGPFEGILTQALALKPDERFHNAAEFLQALDAANTGPTATATSAYRSLGAQPMPQPIPVASSTAVLPKASPTTLRGSTVDTGSRELPRSKLPLVLGLGALVLVGAVGATLLMTFGGSRTGARHTATTSVGPTTAGPRTTTGASQPTNGTGGASTTGGGGTQAIAATADAGTTRAITVSTADAGRSGGTETHDNAGENTGGARPAQDQHREGNPRPHPRNHPHEPVHIPLQ